MSQLLGQVKAVLMGSVSSFTLQGGFAFYSVSIRCLQNTWRARRRGQVAVYHVGFWSSHRKKAVPQEDVTGADGILAKLGQNKTL